MAHGTRFDVCVINQVMNFAIWGLCRGDHENTILRIGGVATIVHVRCSRASGAAGDNLPRTRSVGHVKANGRARTPPYDGRVVGVHGQLKEIVGIERS